MTKVSDDIKATRMLHIRVEVFDINTGSTLASRTAKIGMPGDVIRPARVLKAAREAAESCTLAPSVAAQLSPFLDSRWAGGRAIATAAKDGAAVGATASTEGEEK